MLPPKGLRPYPPDGGRINGGNQILASIHRAIDDTAGDRKGDYRAGTGGALDREFTHDAGGTLAHGLQTEVPRLATMQDIGIHAGAIVTNPNAEILRIRDLNFQFSGLRVHTGVADRLIPDAIHLVTDYGMHLLYLPRHLKRDL